MAARRPLPIPRRRPHRRAALAAGAVGALVLVPASGALADDLVPPEGGDATQPLPGDLPLPSPDVEDQVGAGPEAPIDPATPPADAPDAGAPGLDEAAPPALPADPAAGVDAQAAASVDPYFGLGKSAVITPRVHAPGVDPSAMAGAQVRVDSDGENSATGMYPVTADGTIGVGLLQAPGETLTFTLVLPPPGYMATASRSVVVPPCDVPLPPGPWTAVDGADSPVTEEPPPPPACTSHVEFDVVAQYRTVQLRAVTAAGVPVPGVTFELHSPLAPLQGASVGGGTAAVVVPGRSLVGTSVTSADGVATFATTVPPGAGYLVVPTAVPDGYLLPPAIRLDLAAVSTVAEADAPVVMQFTLVPALAATGTSSLPLAAVATGLLATGGGLVLLRRRLDLARA